MSNKFYDILSIVSRVVLPLGTFILAMCDIWGMPYGEQIMETATAIDVLVGAILLVLNNQYKKTKKELAGQENSVSVHEEVQ